MSAHLQDVAGLVGDEQDVKLLERLVDKSHICRLDRGVLRVDGDEFGERREQAVYTRSRDRSKLPRQEGCNVSGGGTCRGINVRFPLLVQMEAAKTTWDELRTPGCGSFSPPAHHLVCLC